MGQKLGKAKAEIEKTFNEKQKGTPTTIPTGRKGTLTTTVPPQSQHEQQLSDTATSGARSMTLPNPPPSALTSSSSLQPVSTQVPFTSSTAIAPASTQVPFAAPSVPSGMKQSTSGDFSHYNR